MAGFRARTAPSAAEAGGKWRILANIFANPALPEIDDYYEPFTFDTTISRARAGDEGHFPARPRSLITGERMEKIEWGPNWEESWRRVLQAADRQLRGRRARDGGEFENTFMMYLPRLCEHCLNPACVASPLGRDLQAREDGIVLIDQDKCRGWRMCVRLPLQEDLLQLEERQGREVHLLLPAHRVRPADRLQRNLRQAASATSA